MNVEHCLAGGAITIKNRSIPLFSNSGFPGQLSGYQHQSPHQRRLLFSEVVQGGNMFLGNDENMGGRLGIDVPESDYFIVCKDNLRWNGLVSNATK